MALYDMCFSFFGVVGSNDVVSDIVSTRFLYDEAQSKGLDILIYDLEPTAGAERFIGVAPRLFRSLLNMHRLSKE